MENTRILRSLEAQRDACYQELSSKTISQQYEEMYKDIKRGRVIILDNEEREMLHELKQLKEDKSLDQLYITKTNAFKTLDEKELISYFIQELERVFEALKNSGKAHEIQAIFFEYDFYYHYTSCVECYGKQHYPLVLEPRYITKEFDYNKQVLFLEKGIYFKPAWPSCDEFENLDYLDIYIERLFQLHSRILMHKAIAIMDSKNQLDFFTNRPLTIYINEHDCEAMTLYWKD